VPAAGRKLTGSSIPSSLLLLLLLLPALLCQAWAVGWQQPVADGQCAKSGRGGVSCCPAGSVSWLTQPPVMGMSCQAIACMAQQAS